MHRNFSKRAILTVFFTAILLFNLIGSLCLVHCQWMEMGDQAKHCPLAVMDKENCPKTKDSLENDSRNLAKYLSETAIGCCDLNISFVSAHLQTPKNKVQSAKLSGSLTYDFRPFEFKQIKFLSKLPARPPPMLDQRVERITYGVFLI